MRDVLADNNVHIRTAMEVEREQRRLDNEELAERVSIANHEALKQMATDIGEMRKEQQCMRAEHTDLAKKVDNQEARMDSMQEQIDTFKNMKQNVLPRNATMATAAHFAPVPNHSDSEAPVHIKTNTPDDSPNGISASASGSSLCRHCNWSASWCSCQWHCHSCGRGHSANFDTTEHLTCKDCGGLMELYNHHDYYDMDGDEDSDWDFDDPREVRECWDG